MVLKILLHEHMELHMLYLSEKGCKYIAKIRRLTDFLSLIVNFQS